MEVDELYTIKNAFYVGHFQAAIEEARTLRVKGDALRVERDCYIYRAMIALRQYKPVLDEIAGDAPVPLQAVKLLAQYFAAPKASKDRIMLTLEDWVTDDVMNSDPTFQLVAGLMYLNEENYPAGLKVLRGAASSGNAEQIALTVQLYLRMDRPDLAEKAVKALQTVDDESPLAQFSHGWLCLSLGGEKYKEAALVFREIADRHGASASSLTGQAAALVALKRYEEADRVVKEMLSMAPNDPDVLITAITLATQTGRFNVVNQKLIPDLKTVAPDHPYLRSMTVAEGAFDRVAASFA